MDRELLNALREGGYILYARHGEATIGTDQPYLNFGDCYTQRNLSSYGRMQAVRYGNFLRALRIPVGYPALSSPFCRTIETAQLAFGSGNVLIDPFWVEIYNLSESLSATEQERILGVLGSVLEIMPARGTNTAIIAHSFPAGIGLGQIPYMATVILKPLGPGNGYEIIDMVSLAELEAFLQLPRM